MPADLATAVGTLHAILELFSGASFQRGRLGRQQHLFFGHFWHLLLKRFLLLDHLRLQTKKFIRP